MLQTSSTLFVALFVASWLSASPLFAQELAFEEDVVGFIKEHCSLCHDDLEPEAELDLTRFSSRESALKEPSIWFAVEEQLLKREPQNPKTPRETLERCLNIDSHLQYTL